MKIKEQHYGTPFTYKENGDVDFELLYETSIKSAYYIARRLIRDVHSVEDLIQDAYITAFKSLNMLESQTIECFCAWLHKIVLNNAKDYLKKSKPILFSDMTLDGVEDPSFEDRSVQSTPDKAAVNAELSDLVQHIMDALPEDQRICTFLFYYEDMTSKEISEYLALSESTVKSRLRYAKEKIKVDIGKEENKGFALYSMTPISIFTFILKQQELFEPLPNLYRQSWIPHDGLKLSLVGLLTTTKAKIILSLCVLGIVPSYYYLSSLNSEPLLDSSSNGNSTAVSPKPVEAKKQINAFDSLKISVVGTDKSGKLTYSWEQEDETILMELMQLELDISQDNNLANGDVITVKLKNNDESSFKYTYKDDVHTYTVSGLSVEEPVDEIDAHKVIYNAMLTQTSDAHIREIISMFTRDFHGTEIKDINLESFTKTSVEIDVVPKLNNYKATALVLITDANGNEILIGIVSTFSDDLTGNDSVYAINITRDLDLDYFLTTYLNN